MKVAIYIRVSTPKRVQPGKENPFLQNPLVQLEPLQKLAVARNWEIVQVYQDRMTGSKQRESRPGYKALWNDLKKHLVDIVLVWRFDRFSRSAAELLNSLNELRELKIEFVSYTENIDTSTAMGRAMFTMVAAFAEMERESLRERVMLGIDFAREKGTKSGLAIGRPKKIFNRDIARELSASGMSLRDIASKLEVGKDSVRKALKQGNEEIS